ncbi:MAG: hypothetical protein HKN59_05330 [Gammaproteobacteria bacterium]|nr:hypothetical protein [Gammaproteobacteria bacterium]
MDDMVPVAGRVLRYWCGALVARCHDRLYDFLGLQDQAEAHPDVADDGCWFSAEVWSRPEPGHEATIVLPASWRREEARPRVRMHSEHLLRPAASRPGTKVSRTFGCTRSRLMGHRGSSSSGFV